MQGKDWSVNVHRRGEFGADGKLPANDELAERYVVKHGFMAPDHRQRPISGT